MWWKAVEVVAEVILTTNTWYILNGHLQKYLYVSCCYGNLNMSLGNKKTIVRKLDRAGPWANSNKAFQFLPEENRKERKAKKERVALTEDLHGDDAVDPLEIYDILFSLFSLSLSLSFFAASKSSVILYLLLFIQQIGDLWLELVNFVRDIRDPEHPYSLEQLSVLSEESITVDDKLGRILWVFVELQFHCFDFESNWCYLEIEIYDWKYVPNMSKIE